MRHTTPFTRIHQTLSVCRFTEMSHSECSRNRFLSILPPISQASHRLASTHSFACRGASLPPRYLPEFVSFLISTTDDEHVWGGNGDALRTDTNLKLLLRLFLCWSSHLYMCSFNVLFFIFIIFFIYKPLLVVFRSIILSKLIELTYLSPTASRWKDFLPTSDR